MYAAVGQGFNARLRQRRAGDVPTEALEPLSVLRPDDHAGVDGGSVAGSAPGWELEGPPAPHRGAAPGARPPGAPPIPG